MTPIRAREWSATVQRNLDLGSDYGLLRLQLPRSFPRPKAGSFCMISTGESREILLRRPMAFFDVAKNGSGTLVDLLYRVVGRGTRQLSTLKSGASLSLLGPIDNAFSVPKRGERVVVAAGGIGISPFLLWTRQLSPEQKKNVRILFGFPLEEHTSLARLFRKVGIRPVCAVERATTSFQGTVVDLLVSEQAARPASRILTCGPEPMMDAVLAFARERNIPCELSMEARMACGMGVCLSCVSSKAGTNREGYALVCQDGPVFVFPPEAPGPQKTPKA